MDGWVAVPQFMLKYTNYNASQWAITKTKTKDDKIWPEDLLDVATQSIQCNEVGRKSEEALKNIN